MKHSLLSLAACTAFLISPTVSAADPVVIELFTTQGCSSCPPADAMIADLAEESDVIALSWAVDVWDYIGWKDTLSIPESNTRHRWYNALRGSNMVYTPQIFVDGEATFVGNRQRKKIDQQIEEKRSEPRTMVAVTLADTQTGRISVSLDQTVPETAQVKVVYFDYSHTVKIGAGENSGRTITYTNVVRGSKIIPKAENETVFTVDLGNVFAKNCDAFAVLVQDMQSGAMLGAAVHDLGNRAS